MGRPGCAVWLLRRPDLSYLVRTSGRVSTRTHELAWAVTLESPEAARAAAARLETWDRARLDALARGDRLLDREACGEFAWLAGERALLERLAGSLEAGPLRVLAEHLRELQVSALAADERALARAGAIEPTWADARFADTLPLHRGLFVLSCGLQAQLVEAIRAGDEAAAERIAALVPLPLAVLEGPLPGA